LEGRGAVFLLEFGGIILRACDAQTE
jgi:hypothetical protein